VIARPPLPSGPFLVVGLARSGVAAARLLRAAGLPVAGCDSGAVEPESVAELEAAGVPVHARTDGVALLDGVRTLVKSPGVPPWAPVVAAARRRGVEVLGELELGWRAVPRELIAVTGSNGKTTTTELVGHVYRTAGLPVAVVGNVGHPLSALAGTPAARDPALTLVCEASSFQLEDTRAFAPDAALLLNLVDDHLDRHGTFAAYRSAKLEAFARQPPGAVAVLPEAMAGEDVGGAAERVLFGTGPDADVADRDGHLWWRGAPLVEDAALRLRGAHNRENAMAAAAVTLARGLDLQAVASALVTFRGVPHRLETVGEVDGVLYVNDSKATNVAAAVAGISAFSGDLHVVLGGRGKHGDYAPLAPAVAERCRAVYLIGETADEIGAVLAPTGVPAHPCGDLERAVAAARAAARRGHTVLLAPACASYDQYRSFEERGDHFRTLVAALAR